MSEDSWMGFTIAVIVIALVTGGVQCERLESDAFKECLKVTQKPAECRDASKGLTK